jgi:hypothetical protein
MAMYEAGYKHGLAVLSKAIADGKIDGDCLSKP